MTIGGEEVYENQTSIISEVSEERDADEEGVGGGKVCSMAAGAVGIKCLNMGRFK